ncbi:unnamed protein product [Brassicogethes aeneus]|uniref:Uncharacterized protein n=1 Tax=Brassicogethes aeneus TaxID=1431903 RepID=A0A9P0B5L8_BRAAE|nr:unnamed protein product [Brassicogethes aeneus]
MVFPHTYRNEHTETITTNFTYGSWYAEHVRFKIPIQPTLLKLLKEIDGHENKFRHNLAKAISFKTIPTDPKYSKEIYGMKAYVESWFSKLGIRNESFDVGSTEINGKTITLPPITLGRLVKPGGNKKTLCVYLYLDVKDQKDIEGWETDPFTMVEKDAKYYGAGAASSKGNFLCWMHCLESFQTENIEIPVNIKFILESAYTLNSPGMMKFLVAKKQDFFNDIDYVVTNISEWLGPKYPSIVYGGVGYLYFTLTVQKTEDSTTEIEDDAQNIFKTMVNEKNRITIPHFNDFVDQVTPDEERVYESIKNFDPEEIIPLLPPNKQKWDKVRILMDFWRQPSMSVDESQKCICPDEMPIIKQEFTVKVVPKQILEHSVNLVNTHVKNTVNKLNIKNKVEVALVASVKHWQESMYQNLYQAARRATIQIYKEDPDMIREDRGRVIITILKIVFEKPVLCMPLIPHGCNKKVANEHIPKKNFMEATKLLAAFLLQVKDMKK